MSTTEVGHAAGIPVNNDFDPFTGEPEPFFATARRETPVFWHDGLGAYVLTRYADVRRVLGDRGGNVSARPALLHHLNVAPIPEAQRILGESGFVLAPSIVDEDGDDHKLHRTAAQTGFTPQRIRPLEEFIRRQVDQRLDAIIADGRADIVDAMIYEVPATVILHMMGVPDEQMGMVKDFRGPWAVFIWGNPDDDEQIQTATMMGAFGQWARGIAADREAHPGQDIISETIANLRERNALDSSRDWLDSYTLNVVMAGHETTTNSMAGGLRSLLENFEQWRTLVADPTLIPNAVEEMLRHNTGVPVWRQRVIQEMELSGHAIPADSLVYAAINSANRDEDVFPNGEIFDVRRENANRHLAFGFGAHTCMGNHLAKLEMRIMLEELVRRLPHMEITPGQSFRYSPNTTQRGPEHVHIQWDPTRNPDLT
jgi:cytochrome P450